MTALLFIWAICIVGADRDGRMVADVAPLKVLSPELVLVDRILAAEARASLPEPDGHVSGVSPDRPYLRLKKRPPHHRG